jgi:hypothetical protein
MGMEEALGSFDCRIPLAALSRPLDYLIHVSFQNTICDLIDRCFYHLSSTVISYIDLNNPNRVWVIISGRYFALSYYS